MRDMAQLRLQDQVTRLEGSLTGGGDETGSSQPATTLLQPYVVPDGPTMCDHLTLMRQLAASSRFIIIIPIDGQSADDFCYLCSLPTPTSVLQLLRVILRFVPDDAPIIVKFHESPLKIPYEISLKVPYGLPNFKLIGAHFWEFLTPKTPNIPNLLTYSASRSKSLALYS